MKKEKKPLDLLEQRIMHSRRSVRLSVMFAVSWITKPTNAAIARAKDHHLSSRSRRELRLKLKWLLLRLVIPVQALPWYVPMAFTAYSTFD